MYVSGLDTHGDAAGLARVKGFLSVGHDEYWSQRMFDNVVRARDAGLSLSPEEDFARSDPRVQRITVNLLIRMIGGGGAGSQQP